ncbi:uncharacterized protein Dwil_GK26944 [Drosophila willistoni]|uniref:Uncharacterized protein n=1 Tax=Drosophila willistoni TaxID=7260 RepID=A0A0Q9X0H7_DROWI|nr:uncharacterized protein Dwil_GK26944 [Drosophila willistoni]
MEIIYILSNYATGDIRDVEQEQKSALLEANASQLEVASVADNLPSPKSFQSEEILLDVATGEEMPFDLEMTMAIMLVSSNLHR